MNRLTVFSLLSAAAVLTAFAQPATACWFSGSHFSAGYGPTYSTWGTGYRGWSGYSSYYRPVSYGVSYGLTDYGYTTSYGYPSSYGVPWQASYVDAAVTYASASCNQPSCGGYAVASPCLSCSGCSSCGGACGCDPCACPSGNCAAGTCVGGNCDSCAGGAAVPQTFGQPATQPTPVDDIDNFNRDDRDRRLPERATPGTPPTFIDEPRREEPRPEDDGFRRTPRDIYDPDTGRRNEEPLDPLDRMNPGFDRRDPAQPDGFAPRTPDFGSGAPADPAAPAGPSPSAPADRPVPDPLDFGPGGPGAFGTQGTRRQPARGNETATEDRRTERSRFRQPLPALNLDDKVAWNGSASRQRTGDRNRFAAPLLIRTGYRSLPGGDTNAGWVAAPAPAPRLANN